MSNAFYAMTILGTCYATLCAVVMRNPVAATLSLVAVLSMMAAWMTERTR